MEEAVIAHFADPDYKLPDIEEKDASLMDIEKLWLSRECVQRYLRAVKWSQQSAITRLEGTLKWRREFGFYEQMTKEYIEPEAETGKNVIFGYDVERRPTMYLHPSRQNTETNPKQIQHVIWSMERTFDLMGPGVEKLVLLIDFADRAKQPSFSTSRTVLSHLQTHYPERLGKALILNVPFVVNMALKAIMPFVDPVTRDKIRFNPSAVKDQLFTPNQITKTWGGDIEFPYDHELYWKSLNDMCEARQKAKMEKWKELGGTVGLSEWDIQGVDVCMEEKTEEEAEESKVLEKAENGATAPVPGVVAQA
ncbi:hypothetical protein FRC03_012917 [Tulasnella sp. 419]|nr:hypothetical protein FRC03_012917 [Tulasnella sp. 419]